MVWGIVVWIALMVISYLMTPKAAKPVTPAVGELNATVVDSYSPVPVLFGTRLLSNPNLVWYGDIRTTPIKTKGGKK